MDTSSRPSGVIVTGNGEQLPEDKALIAEGEEVFEETVRYRTVGDMSCTGGVRSEASSLEEVVLEIAATTVTERGETRADDRVSEAAMEDRKKEGYF